MGKSPVLRSSPRSMKQSLCTGRRTFSLSGETLGATTRSKAIMAALEVEKHRKNKKRVIGMGLYTNLKIGKHTYYPGVSGVSGQNKKCKKTRGAAPSSDAMLTQESQSGKK